MTALYVIITDLVQQDRNHNNKKKDRTHLVPIFSVSPGNLHDKIPVHEMHRKCSKNHYYITPTTDQTSPCTCVHTSNFCCKGIPECYTLRDSHWLHLISNSQHGIFASDKSLQSSFYLPAHIHAKSGLNIEIASEQQWRNHHRRHRR